jgi:hypothetical protein
MDLQEQASKERSRVDAKFLRELAGKEGVSDVDVEVLRRIADTMAPDRVEPENNGAVGLNRWAPDKWNRRPQQTGMEQQNEFVIRDLLTLFNTLEIPFYIRDRHGEKTGREYSTPERLEMLKGKFKEANRRADQAEGSVTKANKLLGDYEVALRAAIQELKENENTEEAVVRSKIILENVVVDPTASVKIGEANDRGIRRVILDAREVLLRLCMQRIVHDLAPNEQICKKCLGLSIIKLTSPYGIGDRKPNEHAFPFFHQWLSDCHDCYMGKSVCCEHCKAVLPRSRTRCECPAARAEVAAAAHEKETERRRTLPRIKLEAYEYPMVWCDETDKFVNVDHLDDHLAEHPDTTIFACEPSKGLTKPDAEDVIETLQNRATEEASPEDGEDVLDIGKEAAPELDAFLDEWAKKHVSARTLYYPDMNLIVEVDRGEPATDGVRDVQSDDAGGDDAPEPGSLHQ